MDRLVDAESDHAGTVLESAARSLTHESTI
jgi:hypothetical protein